MKTYLFLSPFTCVLTRYLITISSIILIITCSIITKQLRQGKKLQEVKLKIQSGTHIISFNGLAGKIISQTKRSVIIELASGEKKEIPIYLIDYVHKNK